MPDGTAPDGTPPDDSSAVHRGEPARRGELPPARSSATAADLVRLPGGWCDTYAPMGRPLRAAQADLLAETCSGRDFVGVAATGSGKGIVWLVPAGAEARVALRSGEPRVLEPVTVVVVPLAAQGLLHEEEACNFLQVVCKDAMPAGADGLPLHWWPRAVYVERVHQGQANEANVTATAPPLAPSGPVCPRGHALALRAGKNGRSYNLARCDLCSADIQAGQSRAECRHVVCGTRCDFDLCLSCHASLSAGTAATATTAATASGRVVASAAVAMGIPSALPCGVCGGARGGNGVCDGDDASRCRWTCKVGWSAASGGAWCQACRTNQSWKRCLQRKALVAAMAVDAETASSSAAPACANNDDAAMPAAHADDGGVGQHADDGGVGRLGFHETAIAEDYSVRVVVVTASALGSNEGGGVALRGVLATRGIRRLVVDEVHAVFPTSMATYNNALATFGQTMELLCAQLVRAGHPRPQVIGVTSTLPPASTRTIKRLAGMTSAATTVRCNIDRPELYFQLTPLPRRGGERQLDWLQRVLMWHVCHLPPWALAGGIVVFCGTAALASAAAESVRLTKPCRTDVRPTIAYLGTTKLTPAKRRAAIQRFESEPHAVLFTTEAWSHGAGRALVHLVVHADLGGSVLDFWQRSGRGARLGGERAVVSQLCDAGLLVGRARFCGPSDADSVSGLADTLALCRHLATRGCMRQRLLAALGQAQCPAPCGGCHNCARANAAPMPLGALPLLFQWVEATSAAAAFLQDDPRLLRGGHEFGCRVTLSQLIAAPWHEAAPPFDTASAHNMLVLQLLARRSILFDEVCPSHSSRQSCTPAPLTVTTLRSAGLDPNQRPRRATSDANPHPTPTLPRWRCQNEPGRATCSASRIGHTRRSTRGGSVACGCCCRAPRARRPMRSPMAVMVAWRLRRLPRPSCARPRLRWTTTTPPPLATVPASTSTLLPVKRG